MEKLKTKNYLQKRIVHFLFNEAWYNRIKLLKIIWRFKSARPYEMSPILHYLVSANSTVLDIGANMGQYACRFNSIVIKGNGHVHSFEPVAANFNALRNMKKYTGLNNVTINHAGVSNVAGEATIHIPFFDNGLVVGTRASLRKTDGINYKTETIKVITIDNYVAANKIDKVDFIKCDTEGNELNVLDGAKQTIIKNIPILCFEMSYTDAAGLGWLMLLGYAFYYYDKEIKKLRKISGYQSGNLVMLHKKHFTQLDEIFAD